MAFRCASAIRRSRPVKARSERSSSRAWWRATKAALPPWAPLCRIRRSGGAGAGSRGAPIGSGGARARSRGAGRRSRGAAGPFVAGGHRRAWGTSKKGTPAAGDCPALRRPLANPWLAGGPAQNAGRQAFRSPPRTDGEDRHSGAAISRVANPSGAGLSHSLDPEQSSTLHIRINISRSHLLANS